MLCTANTSAKSTAAKSGSPLITPDMNPKTNEVLLDQLEQIGCNDEASLRRALSWINNVMIICLAVLVWLMDKIVGFFFGEANSGFLVRVLLYISIYMNLSFRMESLADSICKLFRVRNGLEEETD